MAISSVLVIGLGSMGRRRIRCLTSIGKFEIYGFDINKTRQAKVCSESAIKQLDNLKDIKPKDFSFCIISTSPESHHTYIAYALNLRIPSFVEASVLDTNYKFFIKESKRTKTPIIPSCTLLFHPAIKHIKSTIDSKKLGKVLSISYDSGQYLPDWHIYEHVKDFYVSKKETGGAREIVPFELTWITDLIGFPQYILAIVKKTMKIEGAELIDDTYNIIMEYEKSLVNMNIDVISRKAKRNLIINFDKGQISWDWNLDKVLSYNSTTDLTSSFSYDIKNQVGYIKNISEKMYVDELRSFLNHVEKNEYYPNNLEKDYKVLKLLYSAEKSSYSGKKIAIK
jgi:predicted dehydrogenase